MAEVKERPILFSGPMVTAILEGQKTQTRRVVKGSTEHKGQYSNEYMEAHRNAAGWALICPYGQPGDRLWVREAHLLDPPMDGTWPHLGDTFAAINDIPECYRSPEHVLYRATETDMDDWRWRPSIHMPRWASRILLEIVSVRVERLYEISVADAIAEGIEPIKWPDGVVRYPDYAHAAPNGARITNMDAKRSFLTLWESINGRKSLEENPWVWVIEFKQVTP
jgi:hypothetical protein